MTRYFQKELENIKKRILSLGSLVEERVRMVTKAIDEKNAEIAEDVIRLDYEIDENEVEVEEEKKEKDVLNKIEFLRKYFIDFGQASCESNIESVKGKWQSPHGELTLEISNNTFNAEGIFTHTYDYGTLMKSLTGSTTSRPFTRTIEITYSGLVEGNTIRYKLIRNEKN